MVGAGLTTIPWAYQQSGILLGITLTTVAFAASYWTCYLVVITAGEDVDYTDTLTKAFGRKGYIAGMISFCINLMVPIIIFFQLLSQNLYPIILAVMDLCGAHTTYDPSNLFPPVFDKFSYTWTCVIIFFIIFAMTAPRDVSIYVKINSFGVVFIVIVVVFLIAMGCYSLTNTDYVYNKDKYIAYLNSAERAPSEPYLAYISPWG